MNLFVPQKSFLTFAKVSTTIAHSHMYVSGIPGHDGSACNYLKKLEMFQQKMGEILVLIAH